MSFIEGGGGGSLILISDNPIKGSSDALEYFKWF